MPSSATGVSLVRRKKMNQQQTFMNVIRISSSGRGEFGVLGTM